MRVLLRNYLISARRSLVKNMTTSLINISGLSVGTAATVFILHWVQNETNFDNYHPDASRIYRLTTRLSQNNWVWETTPLLLADAIKNQVPEIAMTARLNTNNWPVITENGSLYYEKHCAYVDSSWFRLFHYDFIEGNAQSFDRNPLSVILIASVSKRYFGSKAALGRTLHIDSADYAIKGVVADAPINSSFTFNAFIPLAALLKNAQIRQNDEQWSNDNYLTFIKTVPGANSLITSKKITSVLRSKSGDQDTSVSIGMISLKDMHFETEIQNSAFIHSGRNTVYVFSILGFLLLLIACINYVNLTTAKASLRAREVSVRKIAGATQTNLLLHFFIESLIISCISIVTTVVLVQLCLPVFNEISGRNFHISLRNGYLWKVLGITLLVSLVLNSIYPALLLSSFKPLNVFRGFTILKVKDSNFRKVLVAAQFCISVMLIAGTLVIYRQMQFIQGTDLGFNRSQVWSFALPPTFASENRISVANAMELDLLSESSIENVSISNQCIVDMGSYCSQCADWEGRDTSYNPIIVQLSADADFQKNIAIANDSRSVVSSKLGFRQTWLYLK